MTDRSLSTTPTTGLRWPLSRARTIDLAIAVGLAALWWAVAMLLKPTLLVNVLTDQTDIFMPAAASLANPYRIGGFFNPPWAAALLLPFAALPFNLAMLLQLMLYFVLITLLIHKFKGGRVAVLVTLTSFVALNSALELNVEWMVCLGLLLPVRWSLPFVFIKPQTALGYYLGVPYRELVRAVLYGLVFGLIALLLWGHTIPDVLTAAQYAAGMHRPFNAAPMGLIGVPLSLVVGVFLAWRAWKRRDPALSILAWMFFMPYLALYGMLLYLALLAARAPRAALVVSLVVWIIFGSMLGTHVLRGLGVL